MNSRSSQIKEAIKRRSRVIGFTLLGCCIALAVWAGAAVIWQPDNNYPQPNDPTARSLQKINSILKVWEVAGYPVGATIIGPINLPSGATNGQGQLVTVNTNTAASPVFTKPSQGTNALLGWTGAAWVPVLVDANGNLMIGNTFNPAVTNDAPTGLYVRQSTNQVSFSVNTTNLCVSVGGDYNSPTAGVVLWCCTNTLSANNGASGLINTFWYSSLTNQEFRVHFYNQEFAPPATNGTFALTQVQRQWEIPGSPISSTNSSFGDWCLTTTNYVKTASGLGLPFQNSANGKTVMMIAEALGTGKSNIVATATYAKVGAILDKP